MKLKVKVGIPGPPEDSDVLITSTHHGRALLQAPRLHVVAANAARGADYTGGLQGNATIRISDHWNAVAAGGGPDPATVVDIPFPVATACAGTAATTVGSTCTANTSANAVVPQCGQGR